MNKNRILAIIIRHLYIWPRSLERLTGTFGWPLLDLVIWGLMSSYLNKSLILNVSLVTIFLGGLIFWTFTWRTQNDVSVNFLDEAWNKNLINLFASPLTAGEFLVAMIGLSIVKLTFTAISLFIGAFILYHFNFIGTFGLYTPLLMINLLLFGWSYGFLVNGLILRFGYSVQELAWVFIGLIQPFSCVFYPLSALPDWAQKIALILPTTYVFEEMRRILFTGQINWINLLISFSLNLVYLILGLIFFRLMYEKAREYGRLVKLN